MFPKLHMYLSTPNERRSRHPITDTDLVNYHRKNESALVFDTQPSCLFITCQNVVDIHIL